MIETEYTKDYTLQELQVAAMAREIADGDVVLTGVGMPCLAGLLARVTHAPNTIIVTESGSVGPQPCRVILGVGDNAGSENAIYTTSLWRVFSDMQRGYFDLGMVGGAQVDKFGNLNSTAIIGNASYYRPKTRLPGSGGANDVGSSANRTIITMPLDKKRFIEKVDYITTPGHIGGGEDRRKAGLVGSGPTAIITNKCVFRFDPGTKEAYVYSIHPGVSRDEIREGVAWDIKFADRVATTEPPTREQVRLTRILDGGRIYTGSGLQEMDFNRYITVLEESHKSMCELYASMGKSAFNML
jgi:glutaconate CoA-transferase subunit B